MTTTAPATKQRPCPVEATLAVIGGKWKLAILWHLRGGALRFGELRRALQGVTHQMLAAQLRELEADGVVSRKVYAEVPPRVEYLLTDRGRTLEPLLLAVCEWGQQHGGRKREAPPPASHVPS
jgi:DNA-binding HxlR family transcriptional regulator